MSIVRVLVLFILAVSNSACFVPHMIEAVGDLGITPADRKRLLTPEIKKYHHAIVAGEIMKAMKHVVTDGQEDIKKELRARHAREHVFEFKVEYVDFSEDSMEADADVAVRFYEIPRYIVEDRIESEYWVYNMPGGWKLVSVKYDKKKSEYPSK